jgi:hypothetical protein
MFRRLRLRELPFILGLAGGGQGLRLPLGCQDNLVKGLHLIDEFTFN